MKRGVTIGAETALYGDKMVAESAGGPPAFVRLPPQEVLPDRPVGRTTSRLTATDAVNRAEPTCSFSAPSRLA